MRANFATSGCTAAHSSSGPPRPISITTVGEPSPSTRIRNGWLPASTRTGSAFAVCSANNSDRQGSVSSKAKHSLFIRIASDVSDDDSKQSPAVQRRCVQWAPQNRAASNSRSRNQTHARRNEPRPAHKQNRGRSPASEIDDHSAVRNHAAVFCGLQRTTAVQHFTMKHPARIHGSHGNQATK